MLTTLTAIGGLLPLALQGSALYPPRAWVIIGGLVSSTVLARLVTPVMYRLLASEVEVRAAPAAATRRCVDECSRIHYASLLRMSYTSACYTYSGLSQPTMTTKRKTSKATSREGINFVRSLVERQNSTFQEIDLDNDLGNDAYIEFVVEENSTGCCIAAQIKSGKSYVVRPGERYAFSADRDHFEYWTSHTLPVVGIIYDPQSQRAFWVDITEYLRSNFSVTRDGPFTIEAPGNHELSDATFQSFRQHFLAYRERYSGELNLGRALESFADRSDNERCFDGLRALFSFHRQQLSAWYFLISCLSNYRNHPVLRALIIRLCHVPGHGDIAWHRENIIDEEVRTDARAFMRERLDRRDAITLLSAVDEWGFDRGTIGQCVVAIINEMGNPGSVMESIVFDTALPDEHRHTALYLAIDYAQQISKSNALALIRRVRRVFPKSVWDSDLLEIRRIIHEHGGVSFF